MMHILKFFFLFGIVGLTAIMLMPIKAQDSAPAVVSAETCAPVLTELWTNASSACINKPPGFICNGGAPPAAEPAGLVASALAPIGALVDAATVDAMRTPPITTEHNSLGVAWLRMPDPLNVMALLIGDVTIFDVTPADFPAWTSMIINTNPAQPTCAAAPRSVVIFQSDGQANLAINSSSLVLAGTVLVATDETKTIFIGLAGQASVLALGQQQRLSPGEQVSVAYSDGNVSVPAAPPTAPIPFDTAYLHNLPIPLFDRPLVLPQPGFASTQGAVNLRVAPDQYSTVITQVPGGQPLTILGQNPDMTWYHVRLTSGETGWMLADLLARNVGEISAVYIETPMPPQRLGELGTKGRITAPAGVNLRRGPDAMFGSVGSLSDGTLVNLLARSPYMNAWVKVEANGISGWLSLLTLETQAYIDALPIDYDIPPLPTATPIPGSFGNAFPDPSRGG